MKLVTSAAVAAALAVATRASAQPALTPVTAPAGPREQAPEEAGKDGSTALLLSLGGTAGSLALMIAGANMQGSSGDSLVTAGLLSSVLTPSLGHWYAGEFLTGGLALRAGGGLAFVVGVGQALSCWGSEDSCDSGSSGGALMLAGAGLYIGGALYDIATAPRAAERWNATHQHLQLAPTVVTSGTHTGMGLGLGGTF